MRRISLALALLATLTATRALALDPSRRLDLYALDTWREGLPHYLIRTIVQARDGYLWLGTMEGVVRFNGVDFEVFNSRNTPALKDQRIHTLIEDRAGALWIGTFDGGVVREREGRFERFSKSEGLASDNAVSLRESRDGSIWVGGPSTLTRIRGRDFTRYGVAEGLPDSEVLSIAEEPDGGLWLATTKGLVRFDGGRFTVIDRTPLRSLLLARDGTLLAGTSGEAILRFSADRKTREILHTGSSTAYIVDLYQDSRGTIWASTSPTGLMRLQGSAFERLDRAGGLPSGAVQTVAEDREGSLWIGTDSGLARLKDLKFVNWSSRQGLSDDHIRVVTEARGGGLWIGGYAAGINLLRDGKITTFASRKGSPNLFVRTITEDDSGVLWIGTDRGLARIHEGRIELVPMDGRDGKVDAVEALGNGDFLVGTGKGLLRRRGGRFEPFLAKEKAASGVRVILERAGGSLLLGSYSGLLEVKDDAVVHRWTTREGLPSDMVFALHEQSNGDLWIGTHDGLARLRGGRITAITTQHGLPNGTVFQILDDRRGHFWLTSNSGVTRVDRGSIDEVLDGRSPSIRAVLFDKGDGLGSNQCNGATQPAGVRLTDGRLAIPTEGGMTLIDPADLHLNRIPPPVVLREVLVDGKPIDPHSPLPWSSQRYEFRYDGLSLLVPQLVRFRYQIDGFDGAWVDAGSRRTAFYTSLPPGHHVFRVAALNNDDVWSIGEARFELDLEAPPWRRWWALIGYALVAYAFFALAIRLRERALRRETVILEARVADRTQKLAEAEARAVDANRAKSVFLANMSHELRTPLNAVIGFSQLMGRSRVLNDVDREHLAVIRRSGEHLLALINDVLSISKIEAGRLTTEAEPFSPRDAVNGVAEMMRVRAEAAGLTLDVDISPALPLIVIGDEGKLRQVLINLLGNAVKFTSAGGVTVRVNWSDGRAFFAVTDSGAGIDESELKNLFQPFVQTEAGRTAKEGTGLGLVITQQLVRLMGGDISATSRRDRGSTFTFDIALHASDGVVAPRDARRVIGIAQGGRPRILVVDDTRDNRVLLRRLLESVGFEVRDAVNGVEAIEVWRSWRPDLIFMDQRMPVMSGSDAARQIRTEEAAQRRPPTSIIALTASAFEHERELILRDGADEFVVKPYTEETIFEVIRRRLAIVYRYEGEPSRPLGNRVLLVDDEDITRLVSREALTQLGLEVTETTNGADALRRLEESQFDAVLLDVEMPGLDGRETVRRIRLREDGRDLPVIAMTAYDREDARIDGMTDYIGKPIEATQLVEVLSRYVRLAPGDSLASALPVSQ